MRCDRAREALSARLDSELADTEAEQLTTHLTACPACRTYASELDTVHRAVRLRAAEQVPDLTPRILAATAESLPRTRSRPAFDWARYALFTVGMTQLLLALPLLAWGEAEGTPLHAARELGAFGLALSVGMVVVAWQPHRASGLLPMALALGAAITLTAIADIAAGRSPALAESQHFLELVGVALLWRIAHKPATVPQPGNTAAAA